MNVDFKISDILEGIICPGEIIKMYISPDEVYLHIIIKGVDKREYEVVSQSAWRIINREKNKTILGEYDRYLMQLEDINTLLDKMIIYNNSKDDHINSFIISRIGDLLIYSNKIIFASFVSGCGDTINWEIKDVEESKSLFIMSSRVLYYEPEIAESV